MRSADSAAMARFARAAVDGGAAAVAKDRVNGGLRARVKTIDAVQ